MTPCLLRPRETPHTPRFCENEHGSKKATLQIDETTEADGSVADIVELFCPPSSASGLRSSGWCRVQFWTFVVGWDLSSERQHIDVMWRSLEMVKLTWVTAVNTATNRPSTSSTCQRIDDQLRHGRLFLHEHSDVVSMSAPETDCSTGLAHGRRWNKEPPRGGTQ